MNLRNRLFINKIQNINIRQSLGLIILLYVLAGIILSWYVIKDEYYYQSLGEQLNVEQISKFLTFRSKWDWLGFIIIPGFILLKIFFVSVCFEIGSFFLNLKLNYKDIFRISVFAESVFVMATFLRIFWFFFFPDNLTLEYIQNFYPLSLLNLVESENIPLYFIYPLQLINVFELLYWLVLTYLIKIYTNKSFDKSFGFVAKTYGIGLLTWVVLVIFLTIN